MTTLTKLSDIRNVVEGIALDARVSRRNGFTTIRVDSYRDRRALKRAFGAQVHFTADGYDRQGCIKSWSTTIPATGLSTDRS